MNINIYADEMCFINFLVNIAVILISKKFINKCIGVFRTVFVSAAFSLLTFLIVISFLRVYINFLTLTVLNMIMAVILFRPENMTNLIKYTAVIKISSVFINEACLFLCYYFGSGYKISILLFSLCLAYASVIVLKHVIKSNTYYHSVNICCNNKSVNTVGLVDTGNSLVEPISQKPVIIAEFSAVKELLPQRLVGIYTDKKEGSLMDIVDAVADDSFRRYIRVIPFKSIGNENGIMLGFIADFVTIDGNNIKKPVVAICSKNLCHNGTYNTLLSPRHIGGV